MAEAMTREESVDKQWRAFIAATTNIVWGFDPEEILTVGSYPEDLMRVWNRAMAERDRLAAQLAEAQKDTARLDWLEGELRREKESFAYALDSLFRRNQPVTRAAIDAAMEQS